MFIHVTFKQAIRSASKRVEIFSVASIVANTDSSSEPGEHWIAVYVADDAENTENISTRLDADLIACLNVTCLNIVVNGFLITGSYKVS